MVRSRCTVAVRSRFGRGAVEVRSWYGQGVWSRFGRGAVVVRHVI